MKTTEKRMTRCALYAVWALTATALTGCSEELSQMFSETTRVEVEARFVPMDDMKTRAADGLDVGSTGFSVLTGSGSGQSTSSTVNVKVDDGSANYTAYTYDITGSTAIAPASAAPVFPAAVNSVSVYGWYPANGGSTSFSIQGDQQSNVSYCLSDLMLANSASCTRDGNSVTPAALAFRHVMSKVKLVLTPGTGVTITDVALKNVRPTVAIDASSVSALTWGAVSGSAGDVTLLSSGSITSASAAADKTLTGVFPAQTISSSFITVTAQIGGTPSTITYSFGEGSKTFVSGKEYTVNLSVSATQTGSPTVSLADWTSAAGTVNIGSGGGGGGSLSLNNTSLNLTYGGSNGTVNVTEDGVSTCTATSASAGIATASASGTVVTVAPVAAGSTQVLVYASKAGNMLSSVVDVTVAKAANTLTFSPASVTTLHKDGSTSVTASWLGNGTLSYTSSSNTGVATASVSGTTITVNGGGTVGTATLTFAVSEGTNYQATTATLSVTTVNDPGISLASATVGMIVASNGKAYTTSNWSDSYGTKVAVVGYKNGSSGYAVALVNASQNTWNNITNNGANKNVDCTLADGKRGSVPVAPTGTTWKVLNMANYKLVWQAMGSADTYNATSNGLITAAGGTALSGTYWSTQEGNNSHGYLFGAYGWYGNDYGKADSSGVRPVLAW